MPQRIFRAQEDRKRGVHVASSGWIWRHGCLRECVMADMAPASKPTPSAMACARSEPGPYTARTNRKGQSVDAPHLAIKEERIAAHSNGSLHGRCSGNGGSIGNSPYQFNESKLEVCEATVIQFQRLAQFRGNKLESGTDHDVLYRTQGRRDERRLHH
jgi:hypothetical protein